jgi:hypothetical protein
MAKQSAIEQDGSIIEANVPCRVREWTYCNAYIWKMRMHQIITW